jgi:hypothetical protein
VDEEQQKQLGVEGDVQPELWPGKQCTDCDLDERQCQLAAQRPHDDAQYSDREQQDQNGEDDFRRGRRQ